MTENDDRPMSVKMREWFPEARMICNCHRELDVCPADCTNMQVTRKKMREWLDGGV